MVEKYCVCTKEICWLLCWNIVYDSIHHAAQGLDYNHSVARSSVLFTLVASLPVTAVMLFLFTRESRDIIIIVLYRTIAYCYIFRISKSTQLTPNINALLGLLGPQI